MYTRGFSLAIAAIFSSVGLLLILFRLTASETFMKQNPDPQYLVLKGGIVFFLAGFAFILPYIKEAAPSKPLQYSPLNIAFSTILSISFGVFFLTIFLSIFYDLLQNPKDKDIEYVRYLIYFFGLVFGLFYLYLLFNALKKIIQYLRYGKSKIKLTTNQDFGKGDTIRAIFFNNRLNPTNFDITLRNLKNIPAQGSNSKYKTTSGFLVEELYQDKVEAPFEEGRAEFEFQIPITGRSTDYNHINPCYWEIEVLDYNSNFRAFFFITVE